MVSIVRREGDTVTALASVISTAFAVYSRKNADKKRKTVDREAMMSGRWSEGYSFVPFEPKELDRTFIKKATNTDGILVEEEITNSWEGLLAYFQAPNIRFKIRHPLFLAIRFSNVLVILRDALRFPQENEEALRSFICSCGFPLNCVRDPAVKIGHGEFLPPWLIAFRSASLNECSPPVLQKLAELMKVVKGPALGFVPDDSLLPQRYSETFDVTSLGNLYTKLYAYEFAKGDCPGPEHESDVGNSMNSNGHSSNTKRPKTKDEPLDTDAHGDYPVCSTSNYNSASNVLSPEDNTSASSHEPSQAMRSAFQSYFISLHAELRMLLGKVVELASLCVTEPSPTHADNLRRVYEDFTEALSVHAYVEKHVLFKELAIRVPRITESYEVDHEMEQGKIEEISNIMKDVDPKKIAELFIKISELSVSHTIHMQKEEYHLLPYFLDNFNDEEITQLIGQTKSTISQLSSQRDNRINLLNPRHQNAIERAKAAVGLPPSEEHTEEPPEDINAHGNFTEGEDVIALIDEMYKDRNSAAYSGVY